MKTRTLILLLFISISAAAQNGKDISRLVGGTSIFENNKIYGKVKTIENITYVTDTNSYIFTKIYRQTKQNWHFQNYFLAFDTATNIVEIKHDCCHKRFIYNKNIVFETDLIKNTETKIVFNLKKGKKYDIYSKEWRDSTYTLRKQNYSYKYSYGKSQRVNGYTQTISENDSVIETKEYDYKFQFDNSNKLFYRICYWNPKLQYTKGVKYETFINVKSDGTIYKYFIYFNKDMQATKMEETLNGKTIMEIFYEYDYNLLQKVTKNYFNLNSKSIYIYNSRQFLVRKEIFNSLKSKTPSETYNFYYEFDRHGNWVRMFDHDTNNLLVERKITYYE
ncbi:MAG: hypothetical protein LBN95_10960 [Prevotellaceae bacterium]|jgi:hypothetical protein|nr:hypothetical protein [Prevotellaceae bacterium]